MIKFLLLLLCPTLAFSQTITVDIGHFLKSPGTVSAFGEYEFTYNKELGHLLGRTLSQNGYKVNLQGYYGDLSSLEQRATLATGSDLFVSIHHDALQAQDLSKWTYNGKSQIYNDEVRGFGIFVSSKNPQFIKSLYCAKHIASQLKKSGFIPNFYHNKDIPNERKQLLDKNLPVYQYDNLIVLKNSKMPALLIEAGVLTNRQEAQWIKRDDVRVAFTQSVTDGIRRCL